MHKYFPNCFPLSDEVSENGSWIWRGICKGLKIVKQHYCWELADGKDINIWKDKWIHGCQNLVPSTNWSSNMVHVSQLIDQDTKSWNLSMLNTLFPAETVNQICRIRIPMLGKDRIRWTKTRNGTFTVKSAYNTLLDEVSASNTSSNTSFIWKRLWSMKLPPKVLHLLWRILQDCLSTRDKIRIWFDMDATVLVSVGNKNLVSWLTDMFVSNNFYVDSVQAPSASTLSNLKWTVPSHNVVKVNFDVSFISKDLPMGMGLIARNSAGAFLGAKGTTDTTIDEEQGEAIAALEAIKWADRRNISDLHLEGDNKNVVDAINGRTGGIKWTTNNVILECLNLLRVFNNWKCSHVKREANSVADDIAKYARINKNTKWNISPPDFILG
ncbi:uncharacterized protein LOC113331933 [Papaver somniferum]|uniref:uncharacterized protein LOC113331933 n=1 Tax=Papaver somniferum TaxID=3469 RepID=UPI000E6F572B|nr:uncharacterized protein LOC113331933 [Papaver somniferum]